MKTNFTKLFILFLFVSFSLLEKGYSKSIDVNFEKTIPTCLSIEFIWNDLNLAMSDSLNSKIWPNNHSTAKGKGLKENLEITVSYKNLLSKTKFSYTLSEVNPYSGFTYTSIPEKHPFTGGANVKIVQKNQLRELVWQGAYQTRPAQFTHRFFLKNYTRKFFNQIENNIRNLEASSCKYE